MAVLLRFHDPLGDALDALGIGYGGASVLLHDKAHVRSSLSLSLSRTYALVLRSAQSNERPKSASRVPHGETRGPAEDARTPVVGTSLPTDAEVIAVN
ncbi:hypothetical protein GCM10010269_25460 [Streptomyces humidus]|uniref:Uncharacterized protein n=1 Tax=Streptomyces humidus TaxID=52259 RepID=A0A918FVG0_9ACTN|nr:hypothetical protein GCM10010269_25460 [Streptomyces humidus]